MLNKISCENLSDKNSTFVWIIISMFKLLRPWPLSQDPVLELWSPDQDLNLRPSTSPWQCWTMQLLRPKSLVSRWRDWPQYDEYTRCRCRGNHCSDNRCNRETVAANIAPMIATTVAATVAATVPVINERPLHAQGIRCQWCHSHSARSRCKCCLLPLPACARMSVWA